jgi:hypothetical protein
MHQIHHVARIHHGNVAEAADVPVAAPSPRLVARRPFKRGPEGHALRPRQAPNQFGVNDVVDTTTRLAGLAPGLGETPRLPTRCDANSGMSIKDKETDL